MAVRHDIVAYNVGEAKRTNHPGGERVMIGTIPTKYLQFLEVPRC